GKAGFAALDCGELPTPALALAALTLGAPAVMVTGSHIPADRNGLKFYLGSGEITKADETGIIAALDTPPPSRHRTLHQPQPMPQALAAYLERYRRAFGAGALHDLRLGVYEHSSVARDALVTLLRDLGATVVPLGRADRFVPIDTEALTSDDATRARTWVAAERLDALLSTVGDADRVVTPITSNSAIEALGSFAVVRTKVGSPYVIAGMDDALQQGGRLVVGFEA